jgi:hypothetical protein
MTLQEGHAASAPTSAGCKSRPVLAQVSRGAEPNAKIGGVPSKRNRGQT